AVTAVMTLVNAVLVRPLPFGQPDRIVYLGGQTRERPRPFPLGYQDVRDLEMTEATTFAAVSPATGARSFNLTAGTEVEHITGEMVGAAYFDVLGVGLQTGRMFTADEARPPAAASVAVIAYDLWERRFQSDPAIVGRTMELNDRTFEIVGVAAPGFRGLTDEAKARRPAAALRPHALGDGAHLPDRAPVRGPHGPRERAHPRLPAGRRPRRGGARGVRGARAGGPGRPRPAALLRPEPGAPPPPRAGQGAGGAAQGAVPRRADGGPQPAGAQGDDRLRALARRLGAGHHHGGAHHGGGHGAVRRGDRAGLRREDRPRHAAGRDE